MAARSARAVPKRWHRNGGRDSTAEEHESRLVYDRAVSSETVPGGVVHELPADLRVALVANTTAL